MRPLSKAEQSARNKEIREKIERDREWNNPSIERRPVEFNSPKKHASEMTSAELDRAWRSSAFRPAPKPKPEPKTATLVGDDGSTRRVTITEAS